MPWTNAQIENHKEAVKRLETIKAEVFSLIKKNPKIREYQIQKFILDAFKNTNLVTAPKTPIIAFRENTSFVHYYPKKGNDKQLKPNSLILLDIWARLEEDNAPFADLTCMAFYGKR